MVECAWCGAELAWIDDMPGTSHGMCENCRDREVLRLRRMVDPPWAEELYCDEGGEDG